jgi:hypothetical protein
MKVKLKARWLWTTIEKGTDNEDDNVSAMEVLLSSTPQEYHQMLGEKKTAKEAWEALASMRIGSDRAKKAKVQQLHRDFDDLKFRPGETVEDFALQLQSLVSQLAVFGKIMDEEEVVSKFLRVVPPKYTQIALSIETMLDLETLTIEDLTGRLKAVDERTEPMATEKDGGKLLLTEEEWTAWMKEWRSREGSSGRRQAARQGVAGQEEKESRPERLSTVREDGALGEGVPDPEAGEGGGAPAISGRRRRAHASDGVVLRAP